MKLNDLIGKRIVAVKAYPSKEKYLYPSFILFDDRETILELSEQDYYSYHDCSQSARNLFANQDKEKWERFMEFPDANTYL